MLVVSVSIGVTPLDCNSVGISGPVASGPVASGPPDGPLGEHATSTDLTSNSTSWLVWTSLGESNLTNLDLLMLLALCHNGAS